ncbi:uncharacterized protein LOC144617214 isoform X2 [Panthera onca]
MKNHNTYLAPGFTLNDLVPAPVNVVVLRGLLEPLPVGCLHSLYQMSSQQGNCLSSVAQGPPDLTLLLGIRPSYQNTITFLLMSSTIFSSQGRNHFGVVPASVGAVYTLPGIV